MRIDTNRIPDEVKRVGRLLGEVYLIGGAVIDCFKGYEVKDWDVEVFGLNLSVVQDILEENGYECNIVGRSFGVIKISAGGIDMDISVPRRDNKSGIGHKGFDVQFDPSMTPLEAGSRRDLTINSMYVDLVTGEIVDPFNGVADLERGIMRATSHESFVEDPLRVLRVMQLLARKGKMVDSSTVELCRSMWADFRDLPSERVFEEFYKLLMKSENPSMGLRFLAECSWVSHFPELSAMIGCPQNPEHHPEGDVWEHTLQVVDAAAKLRSSVDRDWQLAFMFATLLHDTGKPSTTAPDMTAHGHDEAGKEAAATFMRRITNRRRLIEQVVALVGAHMRPFQLSRDNRAKGGAWRRLSNVVRLDVLGKLNRADGLSRYGKDVLTARHRVSELCDYWYGVLGNKPVPPVLLGRHVIAKGVKTGKRVGEILKAAYEIQLDSGIVDPDELFDAVMRED